LVSQQAALGRARHVGRGRKNLLPSVGDEPMNERQSAAEQRIQAGDDSLGARLRAERERSGLTLRELARRLEVSPSLVSQIETGKSQPSVRTLYAIVTELGISLDELFAPADGPLGRGRATLHPAGEGGHRADRHGRLQRAEDRDVIDLGSGVRWERLTTWNDRDIEFLYAIYEPGGSSSPDGSLMRHNGREFGVVLAGELGVKVGFEDYVLRPGDSIAFDSSIPHRLHNDAEEVVTAIWIVLGRNVVPEHE
jgi:transcriptional regulator with XRE-family HTH domain